jgi:hypothetical protein
VKRSLVNRRIECERVGEETESILVVSAGVGSENVEARNSAEELIATAEAAGNRCVLSWEGVGWGDPEEEFSLWGNGGLHSDQKLATSGDGSVWLNCDDRSISCGCGWDHKGASANDR